MTTALATLTSKLAKHFDMGNGADLSNTLKATCFKSGTQVTDAQMTALLVVANQYGLNPFTKEIFAFPDKGGIVPVVGLDGWSRIINDNPQFDGMDFEQDAESCTCIIYRKDRNHPVKVTEWMSECKRGTGPWQSHPRRMLRHKAMIQCARLAFGFSGIYEQDEAERIAENSTTKSVDPETGEIVTFDVIGAMNAIDACSTPEQWNEVYRAEGAKAVAAKDVSGQNAFKAAAKEKKAQILAAMENNVIDAEVKS